MLNGRMLMMPSLFAGATFATRSEVLSNSIALASRFVTRMTSGLRGGLAFYDRCLLCLKTLYGLTGATQRNRPRPNRRPRPTNSIVSIHASITSLSAAPIQF